MGNLLMQAEAENASGSPPDDEMDIQNLPMAVLEQVRDRLRRAAEEECVPGSRAYAQAELQAQILQRLAPLLRVWPTYVPAPRSTRGDGGNMS